MANLSEEEQIVNDAVSLIRSGKEITYLNLILKFNNIDSTELWKQDVTLTKTPRAKTFTLTVGESEFQLAEFIVNLMAKEYREETAL